MEFPKLKAVIEIENYTLPEFDSWEILPIEGLYFVELSGKTSLVEAGTVIYRLAEYGKPDDFEKGANPKEILQELLLETIEEIQEENIWIISGGLQAFDENQETISPQCCLGLEDWREWFDVTPENTGIWLGHSPDPWIEYVEEKEILRLWADEDNSKHIDFQYERLQKCLLEVEKDLNDFLNVLETWAIQIDKSLAKELVAKFKEDFDI